MRRNMCVAVATDDILQCPSGSGALREPRRWRRQATLAVVQRVAAVVAVMVLLQLLMHG